MKDEGGEIRRLFVVSSFVIRIFVKTVTNKAKFLKSHQLESIPVGISELDKSDLVTIAQLFKKFSFH